MISLTEYLSILNPVFVNICDDLYLIVTAEI